MRTTVNPVPVAHRGLSILAPAVRRQIDIYDLSHLVYETVRVYLGRREPHGNINRRLSSNLMGFKEAYESRFKCVPHRRGKSKIKNGKLDGEECVVV